MTGDDLNYIRALVDSGIIKGPVLELGGGYGGKTSREIIVGAGLEYVATDLKLAPGVDVAANFETGQGISDVEVIGTFATVLVLNVLEHVFNPIEILDNALRVTGGNGLLVVITPVIWAAHNYPIDCSRLLPDWYRIYASKENLEIAESTFEYLGYGTVHSHRSENGQDNFPVAHENQPFNRLWSRLIHKVFNTFGRGMFYPSFLAIGVVMAKPKVK